MSMGIEVITDPQLVNAVDKALKEYPGYEFARGIFDRLPGPKYFWGGVIRDAIAEEIHGQAIWIRDHDLIVDDSKEPISLNNSLRGFRRVLPSYTNRFKRPIQANNTPSYPNARVESPQGNHVDIGLFSNANRLRKGECIAVCMETVLTGTDFTPSALMYDPQKGLIYSFGAIEAIKKKEVDIGYEQASTPARMMAKGVTLADKLNFSLGPRFVEFVEDNFSNQLESDIHRALKDRGEKHYMDTVMETLSHYAKNKISV